MTSLYSFQFQNPAMSQDYVNKYVASKAEVIKVLDPDKAQWLWPPQIMCVARFYLNDQDLPLMWQGRTGARAWFNMVKESKGCPRWQ